jgi:hypothetical protein
VDVVPCDASGCEVRFDWDFVPESWVRSWSCTEESSCPDAAMDPRPVETPGLPAATGAGSVAGALDEPESGSPVDGEEDAPLEAGCDVVGSLGLPPLSAAEGRRLSGST